MSMKQPVVTKVQVRVVEPSDVKAELLGNGDFRMEVTAVTLATEYTKEELLNERMIAYIKRRMEKAEDSEVIKIKVIDVRLYEMDLWILTKTEIFKMTISYQKAIGADLPKEAIVNSGAITEIKKVLISKDESSTGKIFEEKEAYTW